MKAIQKNLREKSEKSPEQKYLMLGDFNFPIDVVTWEKSNKGMVANPSQGDTPMKRCYNFLDKMTEKVGMEQVVEKPTRE